jgi:ClpP class serine protease
MNNVLAARFADSPVMVAPGHEGWLANCLTSLQARIDTLQPEQMAEFARSGDEDWWGREGSFRAMLRPYKIEDRVLQVPVKGMLLHGFPFAIPGMATGYEYIVRAFERGMADDEVDEIAMLIDSGGGEVAGNFDAVDKLYRMRGTKPFTALVNEHAYSAAFSLASAMDKIVVPRTGGVGSVGVVTSHIDQSKRLEDAGIKVTFVHAGAHKVEGNPYEPLSEDAKNRMQARIDGLYTIFVATVARNLGVSDQAVRDTEAQTYSAEEAVSLGFAHSILAFDEALAALGGRPAATGVTTMSHEQTPGEGASTFLQADLDAALAEGKTAGAQAERERIKGIMSSDAAKDRADLAFHLSMNTDLTVESAGSILEASPAAAQPPTSKGPEGSHFEKLMANGNPEVTGESDEDGAEAATSDTIMADYRRATGQAAKH